MNLFISLFQYIYLFNNFLLNNYSKIVYNVTRMLVYKNWPKKLIRNFGNKLGLAWWAKIETGVPCATYWYGPFLTKRSLNENLEQFLNDLYEEGSEDIKHSIIRGNKKEPLTV